MRRNKEWKRHVDSGTRGLRFMSSSWRSVPRWLWILKHGYLRNPFTLTAKCALTSNPHYWRRVKFIGETKITVTMMILPFRLAIAKNRDSLFRKLIRESEICDTFGESQKIHCFVLIFSLETDKIHLDWVSF